MSVIAIVKARVLVPAEKVDEALSSRVRHVNVLLPYDQLGEAAFLRESGSVLSEEYRADGLYVEGIVKTADLHRFTPYLV